MSLSCIVSEILFTRFRSVIGAPKYENGSHYPNHAYFGFFIVLSLVLIMA